MEYQLPYYPSIKNPQFRDDLYKKQEYHNPGTLSYRDPMARFIGLDTPYDRLLIIHAVGTGKTGCAINIVEQYKSHYKRAIILNKSNVPTFNFQDLLKQHFISKGISNENLSDEMSFYKFDTYGKFCKKVQTLSTKKMKQVYNYTIFILDEVHNIITKNHNENMKNYQVLLNLFDQLNVSVVVGMTATPMRDSFKEIIPLANLFTKDPSRRMSERVETFENIESQLKQFANTTVSWYEQDFNYTIKEIGEQPFGLFLKTVLLNASSTQRTIYQDKCEQIKDNSFMDKELIYASLAVLPELGIDVENTLVINTKRQISKIIKHSKEVVVTFNNYIFQVSKYSDICNKFRMNPYEYSCKFAYTMSIVENDSRFMQSHTSPWTLHDQSNVYKGLVYIFCEDITATGIKTLMAMLQHFGYEYYMSGNANTITANYRRFTVYVGDSSICPNGSERLSLFRHPDNEDGKYCRIIIASNVMKESVSLRYVRKVFMWTSHWNYSAIIQAEGRALRKDAFTNSQYPDKVVEIHRLASIMDQELMQLESPTNKEMRYASIDIYKYYKSTVKIHNIKKVENILKLDAIDHKIIMNESINEYPIEDKSTLIVPSDQHYKQVYQTIIDILQDQQLVHINTIINIFNNMDPSNVIECIDQMDKTRVKVMGINKYIRVYNDMVWIADNPLQIEPKLYSNNSINERYDHINEYINTRVAVPEDFNWSMTRSEFVLGLKNYMRYKLCLVEDAVIMGHTNFISYLENYLHKINGIYYHILEKKKVYNSSYNNNSRSVSSNIVVRKYELDTNEWVTMDVIELENISHRIDMITTFTTLKYIIKYGTYGSYSINDGELRIHNYNVIPCIDDKRQLYLDKCNQWIDYLRNAKDVSKSDYDNMKKWNYDIRMSIIRSSKDKVNMNDLRTDKRGLNVESHTMEELILVIVKIAIRTGFPRVFYSSGIVDASDSIKELMNDYKDKSKDICIFYNSLKSIKSAAILKSMVRKIVLKEDVYLIT